MTRERRNTFLKLLFFLSILAMTCALILYALRQNISLFYTPSDIALGKALPHHRIRLGGMVEKGSVLHDKKALNVQFRLTDYKNSIEVRYQGILPDLFREEQGIVAEGVIINPNRFDAINVLAKHDANYMPKEIKEALAEKVKS